MGRRYNENSIIINPDQKDLFLNEVLIDITEDIIPGVYPYYSISNYGRVYHKYTGYFLKPGISGSGYLFVYLSTNFGPKMIQLHRLVMIAFKPNIDTNNLQVNHIDGNKFNNIIDNLEWCTRSENQKHAFKTGLHPRPSTLNENDIRKVCDLLSENHYTNKEISNMVGNGITESIVSDVKQKSSWKDISEEYEFSHRKGKIFTDDMVNNICTYFVYNDIGNLTINDHCKNALRYYGYDESLVDSARKIYTRKYYKNISYHYIF